MTGTDVFVCGQAMERCILQNNGVDIYQEFFSEEPEVEESLEAPTANTVSVLRYDEAPGPTSGLQPEQDQSNQT